MKFIVPFLLIIAVSVNINCNSTKKNIQNKYVTAVNFKNNLRSIIEPDFEKLRNGKVYYYYKDFKVLEVEVINRDLSVKHQGDNVIIGDSTLSLNLTKRYFIFKRGFNIAIRFDSSGKIKTSKMAADSIIKYNGQAALKFNPNACEILRHIEKDKDFLELTFEVCDRKSIYYADSVYYFLTKSLKGFDFSFGEEVDKKYNMKLYKTQRIYHTLYTSLPKDSIGLPRVVTEEMKEIDVKNPEFIIYLCNLFEKEINKN